MTTTAIGELEAKWVPTVCEGKICIWCYIMWFITLH